MRLHHGGLMASHGFDKIRPQRMRMVLGTWDTGILASEEWWVAGSKTWSSRGTGARPGWSAASPAASDRLPRPLVVSISKEPCALRILTVNYSRSEADTGTSSRHFAERRTALGTLVWQSAHVYKVREVYSEAGNCYYSQHGASGSRDQLPG